jgi:nicotinic acetylcholine receptor
LFKDARLVYDPTLYAGQTSVLIPAKNIWLPDIIIDNSADSSPFLSISEFLYANVDYTGQVSVVFSFTGVATRCLLDFNHFPFDRQACPITVSSWSLSADVLNMTANNTVMLDFYMPNNEWDLKRIDVTKSTENNSRLASALPAYSPNLNVNFILNLQRRPLFFMITDVFPCFILNLLTMISFALPGSSQFGLCITIFLTFSVTLVRVTNDTPVQSVSLTAISMFFIMSELIALTSFSWFVCENLMRNNSYIPRILLKFAKLLRKIKRPEWTKAKASKKDGETKENDDFGESAQIKQVHFDLKTINYSKF